ncbi:MAG: hypothetical protein HXX13_14445, partial [Bacteroidetes bacterium]|nr:hypothetical protein [Bacteroidota bacterium]
MKTRIRVLRWLLLLLLLTGATGVWAQSSTAPTQTVCPGTEPYLVNPASVSNSFLWTITPGVAGVNWTISTPNTYSTNVIWENLTGVPQVYTLSLTEDNGSCQTTVSVVVTVNPRPAIPTIGPITQPTCAVATGSVVLNGLPAGNWTINPGAIAGTGVSTTINGLAAGTYNFTVTNANGCISQPTPNVVINAQPAPPAAPVASIVQPTCAVATGTITVTSPLGATYEYSLDGGAFQASVTFNNVAAGVHTITVRSTTDLTCTNSSSVTINAQPAPPAAPVASIV